MTGCLAYDPRLLCILTPPLCRMARTPAVHDVLAALQTNPPTRTTLAARTEPLLTAMLSQPEDTLSVLCAITGTERCRLAALPQDALLALIREYLTDELLAFFCLCRQCRAEELLCTLSGCAVAVTAQTLAALISRRRMEEAMNLYGLQLLWRLCGDPHLPDAYSLFQQEALPPRSAGEIRDAVLQSLSKGGPHD